MEHPISRAANHLRIAKDSLEFSASVFKLPRTKLEQRIIIKLKKRVNYYEKALAKEKLNWQI
jgi:hypothetical protein